MHIQALESQNEFRIFVDSYPEPVLSVAHDEDFPVLNIDGYDDETEAEDIEWDDVELVTTGCPIGYLVIVFKLKGRPILSVLYGPEGYIASFGSLAMAIGAAKADDVNRRPSDDSTPTF